jgi:hypothetical protein
MRSLTIDQVIERVLNFQELRLYIAGQPNCLPDPTYRIKRSITSVHTFEDLVTNDELDEGELRRLLDTCLNDEGERWLYTLVNKQDHNLNFELR